MVNNLKETEREENYWVTHNATVHIFKISRMLRKANYSREATKFLAFNVLCLDNNLILTTAKYLYWRVKNYVELAAAYADLKAYKAASKAISYGLNKVLYLKQIEEQDPPVPDATKEALVEGLRVLRSLEIKYQLHSGEIVADSWKKKVEETFDSNKLHRALCIVESLTTHEPENCRVVA